MYILYIFLLVNGSIWWMNNSVFSFMYIFVLVNGSIWWINNSLCGWESLHFNSSSPWRRPKWLWTCKWTLDTSSHGIMKIQLYDPILALCYFYLHQFSWLNTDANMWCLVCLLLILFFSILYLLSYFYPSSDLEVHLVARNLADILQCV